jgi:hypothetical protein
MGQIHPALEHFAAPIERHIVSFGFSAMPGTERTCRW